MHMLIALGHKSRVGKDTLAYALSLKYNAHIVTISSPVYDIANECQRILNYECRKDPKLLQTLATALKECYGDDIWLNRALDKINLIRTRYTNSHIIVTDMRFPNEMAALKSLGFTTIRIDRRYRTLDRNPFHISEIALDDAAYDHTLFNNDSIEDFILRGDMLIRNIYRNELLFARL